MSSIKTTGNFKIDSINFFDGSDFDLDNTSYLLEIDYSLTNPLPETHTIMSDRKKDVIIISNGNL